MDDGARNFMRTIVGSTPTLEPTPSEDPGKTERLALEWCALNRNDHPERQESVWARMRIIENAIGLKECLKTWNRGRVTSAWFEIWWRNGCKAPR